MKYSNFLLLVFLLISYFNAYSQSESLEEKKLKIIEQHRQNGDSAVIIGPEHYGSFQILDGDTINKIDEAGLLQGEWQRIRPNGDFKCKGRYKDRSDLNFF